MTSYIHWIREQVGHLKIPIVYAGACISDGNGRILWHRRSDFNIWGLPGGALELDESLTECVIREVQEETGLIVRPTSMIGLYSSPSFDVHYPNGDEAQQVTVCFECEVTGGKLQVDGVETLELAWFPSTSIPITLPWYQAMVADRNRTEKWPVFAHDSPGVSRSQIPFYQVIRPYIGQSPYICPGACAIVKNPNGEILLQLRSDTNQWNFPGGALEIGERLDQTAVNEVREETGLEIIATRLLGVVSPPEYTISYPNGDAVKVVGAFFECSQIGGKLKPDGIESIAVRFFPTNQLPANMDPLASAWIERGILNCNYPFFI